MQHAEHQCICVDTEGVALLMGASVLQNVSQCS